MFSEAGLEIDKRAKHSGVTIVETLVVVGILVLVLAIAIPLFTSSMKQSKLDACKANMVAIYQAEEAYRVRNRRYADSTVAADKSAIYGTVGTLRCPAGDTEYSFIPSSTTSIVISCTSSSLHGGTLTYSDGQFTQSP